MKFMRIDNGDVSNGEGLRVVLWVSGCGHKCKNCQNPQTWNKENGECFTNKTLDEIIKLCSDDFITGLTISGGDPLMEYNISEVIKICKTVKELYPSKDIWIWTGYEFKDIPNKDILDYCDVIVDGMYDEAKPTLKKWRGSDNQLLWKKINSEWVIID